MPDLHDRLTEAFDAVQAMDRLFDKVAVLLDDETIIGGEGAAKVDIATPLNAVAGPLGDLRRALEKAVRATEPQTDLIALANRLVGPREVA